VRISIEFILGRVEYLNFSDSNSDLKKQWQQSFHLFLAIDF
jgi:hypothetical protein